MLTQHVTQTEEGYTLHIDTTGVKCAGVNVESVSMFIGAVDEDGEGYYGDGDLAVNWSMEGLQNDETARTAGMLLLRNVHSADDVTNVMGEFYWQHAFDEQLRAILQAAGFSAAAAADVSGSEWGMQDEGRASYDAYSIADEVRAAMQKELV